MLKILFTPNAWDDYQYWISNDKKTLKEINNLIKDIHRDPEGTGLGKAEKLCYELSGFLSKRIDLKNRMVYKISDDVIEIVQLRFHYK